MKIRIILIFLVLAAGCSTLSKLKRYEGKPIQSVIDTMGKPSAIAAFSGDSLFIYKNEKLLQGAEINKGQTTLDPMVTPSVTKSETLIFRVKGGVVINVKKEIEYNRR